MKYIFFFLTTFAFSHLASAQPCSSNRYQKPLFSEVNIYEDITYSTAKPYQASAKLEDKDYHFDFYEPMDDRIEKRPLVLMFCGGDFQKGDKKDSQVRTWCDSLATYGFTCAAVNYRLGYNERDPRSVERAIYRSVQDVRAAIRYFKEFHSTFKIDTSQIYIGGDEAGAVAVLHAAFMQEEKQRARATYGIPAERRDLGCLDCSGNPFKHSTDIAGLINMRGKITAIDLEKAKNKIPIIHIDDNVVLSKEEDLLLGLNAKSATALHQELDRLGHPTKREDVSIFNASSATGIASSEQIWNAVWLQIRNFLFSTMDFYTPEPTGPEITCAGKPITYEVRGMEYGTNFCWQVRGGRVVETEGNKVKISWDFNRKEGKVRVTATNHLGVTGRTSNVLEVKLREGAVADFKIQKVEDNVITVQDISTFGSFFTIDFGDGSSPQSGKPGEEIVHTYDLKGRYTITQIVENNCGTSMNTQPVQIRTIVSDSWSVLKQAVVMEQDTFAQGNDLTIPLNGNIHYKKVRIKIENEENKLFDEQLDLTTDKTITLKAADLKPGKHTISIIADGNTVRQYFLINE